MKDPALRREAVMTPQQIRLVQSSYARLKPEAAGVAASFYERLFVIDPALRGLFRDDLARQGERLMHMIGAAVGLLNRPETLFPVLHALGARHVGYGVKAEHYDSVGTALIDTLEAGLGSGFTSELRAAWQRLFEIVRCEMLASPAAADLPRRQAVPAA
jgi:hemoglobin-like flavoprotein